MSAATLPLLFLAQQVLLPDALDSGWFEDIMNPRRQEGHGLELVLELSAVYRRSNVFFVLVELTYNHLLNPPNNTNQVTC